MHLTSLAFSLVRAAAVVLLSALLATAAQAMSLRELRALALSDKKQGESYVLYYLVGAMEGVLEAHAQGVRAGVKPTICLNGHRPEPRLAVTLYEAELQRHAGVYEADMPVALVLANALTAAYPC